MKLEDILSRTCPWLAAEEEDSDVVISSRIRLARNLSGFPFAPRATENDRCMIRDAVRDAAAAVLGSEKYAFVNLRELESLDKEFLTERQIISRTLCEFEGTCAAVLGQNEQFCMMINEEDHLRIHILQRGLALHKIWTQIDQIDSALGSKLDYVFHKKYGFLTASPTNTGTGMRISVMLHLPALVLSREAGKVFRSLQKAGLSVKGLYGEDSSHGTGDLFLIRNQITLGKSEEELISKMADLIPQVIDYERQARCFLLKNQRTMLFDQCCRSVQLLGTAQIINTETAMQLLSSVRLGIYTGLIENKDKTGINLLFLAIQPAHLQKNHGRILPSEDHDVLRADMLRRQIGRC
jgi:protein arginine kinase